MCKFTLIYNALAVLLFIFLGLYASEFISFETTTYDYGSWHRLLVGGHTMFTWIE